MHIQFKRTPECGRTQQTKQSTKAESLGPPFVHGNQTAGDVKQACGEAVRGSRTVVAVVEGPEGLKRFEKLTILTIFEFFETRVTSSRERHPSIVPFTKIASLIPPTTQVTGDWG